MSRAWLPRRILAGIETALAGVVLAAALAAAPRAAAQDPNSTGGALTVLGSDSRARACANFVNSGSASDEAVEACTRALANPRLTREGAIELHSNRGIIYLRRHEGQQALADFEAAIALDPDNAEAHLNRGAALVMLQQPGPAVAEITQALSLGVREPEKAYFNRGAAREALGDLRGAYEDYSTALEIRPDWGPANEELARFVRGRREHLATVLNQSPNTP
jgi:tetratricopeptide (TPR) repeat protein